MWQRGPPDAPSFPFRRVAPRLPGGEPGDRQDLAHRAPAFSCPSPSQGALETQQGQASSVAHSPTGHGQGGVCPGGAARGPERPGGARCGEVSPPVPKRRHTGPSVPVDSSPVTGTGPARDTGHTESQPHLAERQNPREPSVPRASASAELFHVLLLLKPRQ